METLRVVVLALVGSMAAAAACGSTAIAADPTLEPGFPVRAYSDGGTYAGGPATAITVGDVDGDERPDIVASAVALGPVYAWHGDGSPVDGWPRGEAQGVVYPALGELSRRTPGFEVAAGAWGDPILAWDATGDVLSGWPLPSSNYVQTPPTLSDVDNDGIDEIFINQSSGSISGFSAAGDHLLGWPPQAGRPTFGEEVTPAVADLDGDGTKEIVSVAGTSYDAYVFVRRADGTSFPGFPLRIADRGMVRITPAIGDVDGDGTLEIVAPYIAPDSTAALAVVSPSGAVERRLVSAPRVGNPPPTAAVLADLTSDGVPEILMQVDSRVDVWSGKDGRELTGWPQVGGDEWSSSSPVVGDVDGDQDPDVVVQSMRAGDAQGGILRAYDRTGTLLPGFPKEPPFGSGDLTPAIADIDGDRRNEIVVAGFEGPYAGERPYVWVYDLGGGPHGPIEWGQFGGGPRHEGRYHQTTTPPPAPAPAGTPVGTAGIATRVADLRPGAAGSAPSSPELFGGELLVSASDGAAGRELFATDGTAAGTHLVRDIWSGSGSSAPRDLVKAGNRVFFSAATAATGRELWMTDGTAAGTVLVKDIWPGADGSEPHNIAAVGDVVFFSAWDGQHGFELWRSDGTAAGTAMVADSLVATVDPSGAASAGAPTLLTPFRGGLAYSVGYID